MLLAMNMHNFIKELRNAQARNLILNIYVDQSTLLCNEMVREGETTNPILLISTHGMHSMYLLINPLVHTRRNLELHKIYTQGY